MTKQEMKRHFSDRYQSLQDIRRPMEYMWDLIDEVILPYVFESQDKDSNPSNASDQQIYVNRKIYDGTPMNASLTATNAFCGTVIPQASPWVSIIPEDENMSRDRALSAWGKDAETHVYNRLNRSNFYESRTNFVKLGFDYGTTASYRHTDPNSKNFVFETLAKESFYIDDNEYGECDTLWRDLWMYNKHIHKNFSIDSAPEGIRNRIMDNPNEKTLIIHAVEPRADFDPTSGLGRKKRWGSYYILYETMEILEESGFDTFPYKVWRPSRESGLVWGLGPGIFAIRDSHVLQAAAKTMIDAANRAVDPPWAVPKNIEGEEELFPGGRTYVNPEDMAGLAPLISGMNYPLGKDWIEELRQSCNRHYKVDIFMMLNQLQARDRTALEVSELQAEKSSIISSTLSSFTSGYLDLELEEIIVEDLKEGILKPFVSNTPGVHMKFHYIGPLPSQQRTFHKTAGIRRLYAEALPVAKFIPSILDWLDEGEFIQTVGEGFNALNGVRTADDVKKIQQARAQAQAQQAQMQMQNDNAKAMAEVASKGGSAPDPGSLAQKMGIGQ